MKQVGGGLQLGEACEEVSRTVEFGVLSLKEDLTIALNDQGISRIYSHLRTIWAPPGASARGQ